MADQGAHRIAAAGLRRRRDAGARCPRARAPWLGRAATFAVAGLLAGPALSACGTRPAGPHAAGDPPLVAVAGTSAHGSSSRIELVSPATGRVARVVAHIGTGNGFALSPDSRDLYVVGPVGNVIEIRRITVATGKVSFVADGAYPAVSPNGRYLAYATGRGFTSVAVRGLPAGRTRVIDLRGLLGNGGTLLNQGAITWLGNSDEVVVLPGIPAFAAAARTGAARATQESARTPPGRQPFIVVKVSQDGLAARRIVVPDPYQAALQVISGDLSQRRAFLIAQTGFGAPGTITRVSLRGGGYATRVVGRLPQGVMPVVLAPRGDFVLYLSGHTPPVLWAAAIRNGRLTGQHRLFADTREFGVSQAAW